MKCFTNKIKMLRRAAAVLCMLAMLLVLAIPCYATEADASAAEEEVRTIAAVVTDGDTVFNPVSDANVSSAVASSTDVSGTDVSASDAEGSSLQDTFKIMGQGMLGIFVVMLLIYLVIVILNVTTGKKKNDDVKL